MSVRALAYAHCSRCGSTTLHRFNACIHHPDDEPAPSALAAPTPRVSRDASPQKFRHFAGTPGRRGRPRVRTLSPGEARVVELFAEFAGQPLIVTRIAERLGRRRCTVSNWLNRSVAKLGLATRAELLDYWRTREAAS